MAFSPRTTKRQAALHPPSNSPDLPDWSVLSLHGCVFFILIRPEPKNNVWASVLEHKEAIITLAGISCPRFPQPWASTSQRLWSWLRLPRKQILVGAGLRFVRFSSSGKLLYGMECLSVSNADSIASTAGNLTTALSGAGLDEAIIGPHVFCSRPGTFLVHTPSPWTATTTLILVKVASSRGSVDG